MALSSFGCLRDRETYYAGFSWHSTDARIMKEAGGIFAAARTQGGRTSVDWEGFLPVTNGFFPLEGSCHLQRWVPVACKKSWLFICRPSADQGMVRGSAPCPL